MDIYKNNKYNDCGFDVIIEPVSLLKNVIDYKVDRSI